MKIHHNFGAQRSASMQAEFKDIRTGNKGTDKLRVSEQVESAFLGLNEFFIVPKCLTLLLTIYT